MADRREAACGNHYCGNTQDGLQKWTGDRGLKISCDEFPFAATEEGGNFLATLNQNPTNARLICVPVWQDTLQGNCNSKSLPLGSYYR